MTPHTDCQASCCVALRAAYTRAQSAYTHTSEQRPLCLVCGNEYGRGSKPVWVFDASYQPLGQAHKACFVKHCGYRACSISAKTPLRVAQFQAWLWNQPLAWGRSDEDLAHKLGWDSEEDGLALGDRAEETLAYWQTTMQLSPERIEAVRAVYAAQVERFEREVTPGHAVQ